jgi:hypothetical protein
MKVQRKLLFGLDRLPTTSDTADMIGYLAEREKTVRRSASATADLELYEPIEKLFDDESWTALGLLLHRQWTERVWIIQEVTAHGRNACLTAVWCGKRTAAWQDVLLITQVFYEAMNETDSVKFGRVYNPSIHALTMLEVGRHNLSLHWILDILGLMDIARDFHATDPRDKIYSLLAIAIDGQEEAFRPNYDLGIYLRFATHLIEKYNNLDILGYCFHDKNFSVPY